MRCLDRYAKMWLNGGSRVLDGSGSNDQGTYLAQHLACRQRGPFDDVQEIQNRERLDRLGSVLDGHDLVRYGVLRPAATLSKL